MVKLLSQSPPVSELKAFQIRRTLLAFAMMTVTMSLTAAAKGQTTGDNADKPEVAAVLEQLRISLNRVQSIQYKYEYIMSRTGGGKIKHLHQTIEFVAEGSSFFNSILEKSDIEPEEHRAEYAYDGKLRQRLLPDKQLDLSRSPDRTGALSGTLGTQPIVVPFSFALQQDPSDFNTLLNRSTWDEIARKASLKGEEKYDGRSCSILTLEPVNRLGVRAHLTVYLDKGLDYYPVKIVRENPKTNMHVETIVTTSKVATAQGDVVIPMKISTKATKQSEVVQTEDLAIEPASLKVNQPVDRSVFTIDAARATGGIYDLDKKSWIKPTLPTSTDTSSSETGGGRFLIVFLLLSSLLIAGLLYRKFLVKKTANTSAGADVKREQDPPLSP